MCYENMRIFNTVRNNLHDTRSHLYDDVLTNQTKTVENETIINEADVRHRKNVKVSHRLLREVQKLLFGGTDFY